MKDKILKLLEDKKKTNIVLLFLVLVGLIFVLMPITKEEEKPSASHFDHNEYITSLEEKIADIASKIVGGEATATLTLETGTEYVYLDQNTTEEQKKEQSYIVIEDSSGGEKALIVTEKMPLIRGVVVVAKGANNGQVEAVKTAVAALLNIRSSKISVIN